MRLVLPALVIAAAAVGFAAAPARADRPATFTDTATFEEPNPCNLAETQTTTLVFDVSEHTHRNNMVTNVAMSASTSNGFSGTGHETHVFGPKIVRFSQPVMVSNPDTGERYRVGGVLVMKPDGVVVDKYAITCLHGRRISRERTWAAVSSGRSAFHSQAQGRTASAVSPRAASATARQHATTRAILATRRDAPSSTKAPGSNYRLVWAKAFLVPSSTATIRQGEREKLWEVILNQESIPKQLAGMTVSWLAAKPARTASVQKGGPCLARRTATSHGFSHSPGPGRAGLDRLVGLLGSLSRF
jgi:hypothetical protein